MSGDRKLSADTFVNPDSGIIEVDASVPVVDTRPAMSENEAIQNTRILMDTREMVQAYGIAWFCDGTIDENGQYKYSHADKENLIRAWSRVVQSANIRVGPWFDIAVTELMCTGPLVGMAIKNRKLRIENDEMKARIRQMNAEKSQSTQQQAPPQHRRDIKTLWKIDNSGFFEYNENLQRIPIPERKIKPVLTESNYELLVKHNSKAIVDAAFNLNAND